jgi:nucleotide-binding universal stress UspA family protein
MLATFKKIEERTTARVRLQKILFATDFSESANMAMSFAAGLAQCFGAKLYTVNVQEPINVALRPQTWEGVEVTHKMGISAVLQAIHSEFPELKPEVIHAEGAVWAEVVKIVKKYDIDLVVIGTRGRTGLGRLLLGSQAEEILRHSTCPVYTVGPNVTGIDRQHGKMRSILYATDFGHASMRAAPYAVSLAEECATRLAMVHVIEKREANELPCQSIADTERRLEELVSADARLWCEPAFVIEHGEPWRKIIEVAANKQADLIVLGVHREEGVPGASTHLSDATVHNVITHASCPVMTVPAYTPKRAHCS